MSYITMNSSMSKVNPGHTHDTSEIYIVSLASVCDGVSNDCREPIAQNVDDIPKTIRNKFYTNINIHEKKWSATCILCDKVQYDTKGVTSSMN